MSATTLSPVKATYLDRVRSQLGELPGEDLEEVMQDLEAHLAELDDSTVEGVLGTPAEFAREFLLSAGLEPASRTRRLGRLQDAADRLDRRLHDSISTLGERLQWEAIRPTWIWIRGWLVVGALGLIYYEEPFRHFPIPSIEHSTAAGLVLVVVATWFSRWVDRVPLTARKRAVTRTYSMAAVIALLLGLLNPVPDQNVEFIDPIEYISELTSPTGTIVENIYAFDVDGNPVEVLLFNQEGEPLRTMSEWAYDDAQSGDGVVYYGNGSVRFQRDESGWIIPNLYPLQQMVYDESGVLRPVPAPGFGFPNIPQSGNDDGESTPTTITGRGDVGEQ